MDDWGVIPLLICGCFILLLIYVVLRLLFSAVWAFVSTLLDR